MKILDNPSRSRGYRHREEALALYATGSFDKALERFKESRRLVDDSFFDLLAVRLCRCYQAFIDMDLACLKQRIRECRETLDIRGVQAVVDNRLDFAGHLNGLDQFASGQELSEPAGYAELARIYSRQNRHDFAVLLWYRTMEAVIQWKLQQLCPGFRANRPDYEALVKQSETKVRTVDELAEKYGKLGDDPQASLPPRIALMAGFGLLCLLTDLPKRFRNTNAKKAVQQLRNLSEIRNQSYLAHGNGNLSETNKKEIAEAAVDLARAAMDHQFAEFEGIRAMIRPCRLQNLLEQP